MNPIARAVALMLLLAAQGAGWAGPVAAPEPEAALAASAPALQPAEPAASAAGSALAAEIITEAGATPSAETAPRPARRETARESARALAPPAAAAHKQAPATDDPWGVREVGKATLQWVKDAVPWLRGDDDARDAPRDVASDHAEWSASSLEGGAERGARPGTAPVPAAHANAATDPLNTVGYGETTTQPKYASTEPNAVRLMLDAVREVLDHPMTWLVLALIVIGAVAVKKIDRRPTE